MVRDADNAMYQAKAGGRGRYVIFDRAMHDQAVSRLTTEGDLRRSIERGELRVHYQPVVSLDTGRVVGFEALVRWQHPDRGMIAPGEFIGIAEETGFIDEIGAWVLGQACRQLADWRRRVPGGAGLTVSVNASTRQLADPGFPDKVRAALADSGLAPDGLILETTEAALAQERGRHPGGARIGPRAGRAAVPGRLRDPGTRRSACCTRFPLDGLKIDRSFVGRRTTAGGTPRSSG
jgi:EAL domain-containing protein (putative c-di-GMP-specific phosphodiesterase class I)